MPNYLDDYVKASRMAEKDFRGCVFRGEYPYLQVLDDILQNAQIEREEPLGLVDIPLDAIAGTKTEGRKAAFARNFMPLLKPETEFATKWMALCEAQETEGIRDPIKAYEYMNRFYVQEGNKRVSVMKYYGAASISGSVTRIVPKRSKDKENRIYYEFMDFYAHSKVNCVWFSKPGRFAKLQRLLGKRPGQMWTAEERLLFTSVYYRFERAFREKSGGKLPITAGDALLALLKIYPYDTLRDKTEQDYKKALDAIWSEVCVLTEQQAVSLSLEPKSGSVPILARLRPEVKTTLNVAFLHERSAETSGWTYAHELGRSHLEKAFGARVHTTMFDNIQTGLDDEETIERAIEQGSSVIFTTTPKLMDCSLKAAVRHPDVRILNCSLNMKHPYIRTYYGRVYEAKFLVGVIAGALADNNRVGYVASYPIYGMTAGVNAFALGAQMANPRCEVYLEWSSQKGHNAEELFREKEITIISGQDSALPYGSHKIGLYHVEGEDAKSIAMPFWHWGEFYEKIIRSVFNGTWKTEGAGHTSQAINYWWGLGSGVIDVLCTRALPAGTKRLMQLLREELCAGRFHPFAGVLHTQYGETVGEEDGCLDAEQILKMDWLAENVVGVIPQFDELTDVAKPLVRLQGLRVPEGGAE